MIPAFTASGYLPIGVHEANLDEFKERFVFSRYSDRRFRLFDKLSRLLTEAKKSGIVRRVIIAGSFVTNKDDPNDFDCVVVLDPAIVGQELRPYQYKLVSRKTARRMFGGDIVPAIDGSSALDDYLDFFQTTRDGERVGVVEIEL
jgi:hypothetical protein